MYVSADGNSTRRHLFLAALFFVTLAALSARLYRLDAESLWMDELVTAETYPLSLPQIILKAADEGQPPLDNLIGALLSRLGLADSDWWVRFPAAMFGSASVFLLGWWVSRIGGAFAGIGAAVLLSVCPLHIYMSQEVRPYALFFFLALATVLAFGRARRRQTFSSWCLFGGLLFCALMTRWTDPHFLAMAIAVYALGAFLHVRFRGTSADTRNEMTKLWAAATTIAIAYAMYNPFFGIVLDRSLRAVASHPTDVTGRMTTQLLESFKALFFGYSTRTVFSSLPGSAYVVLVAGAFSLFGLIMLLVRGVRGRDPSVVVFLATMVPFPFAYAFVFAQLGNAIPKPQYLLLGAVPVLAGIAVGADALRRPGLQFTRTGAAFLFIGVLGVFVIPMGRASVHSLTTLDKQDWRGVMTYLRTHSSVGDGFATVATDTVPPAFHVGVYGRARYGREDMKFLSISLDLRVDALDQSRWVRRDNTVWIVGYNDRMYLGYDQLPTPAPTTTDTRVHSFNGLFIMELPPGAPAASRLIDGLAWLYEQVPDGRSLIAPAIFCGRYLWARGNEREAARSFDTALRQCCSKEEAAILTHDYIAPLTEGLALTASDGLVSQREP
jgi:hypothetical protein